MTLHSQKWVTQDPFQCGYGGFPTPTSNSRTPARCLRIQLRTLSTQRQNQIAQVKRLSPIRTVLYFTCQSQAQVVTCTSDHLAINQRLTQPPPCVQLICQNCPSITDLLQRIQINTDEGIHRTRSPRKELLASWRLGPGEVVHGSILVPQNGSSPKERKELMSWPPGF